MSIGLYCQACYKTSKIGSKKCNCGNSFKNNRKYRVRYKMPNGKWKSRVVDTLDLARSIEGQYRADKIKEKDFGIYGALDIGDVWKNYLAWAKVNKRTWKDDKARWEMHVAQHVKNKPMDKITPRHIENMMDDMRGKMNRWGRPYAPATIKQVLVLIKRLYNWAIQRDLYNGVNPATKVEAPKFDNQVTNPLSKEDLKRLLIYLNEWENERASLLIKFALFSGRRRGEILTLKWKDVNLEAGYVTFIGTTTKNKRTQSVPLNANCLTILSRCYELKLSEWVFPSHTGSFFHSFEATWARLKRRLKFPYRFHDLRHSFASYLASSGKVDILTLKELLGHRELKMTQRYAHLINGALQKGANVADEVINLED